MTERDKPYGRSPIAHALRYLRAFNALPREERQAAAAELMRAAEQAPKEEGK